MTEYQQYLIKKAKSLGFGYAIFAVNVEQQGFCSVKQQIALENMISSGEYRKNNWKPSTGRSGGLSYKHNLTDCEIMSFDLYL